MNKQKEEFDEDYQNIEQQKSHATFTTAIPLKKTHLQPAVVSHAKVLNQTADQLEAFHRREQGEIWNIFHLEQRTISFRIQR